MAYKRGDVLLVPFPFSDLTTSKTRPAVVVSSDAYHKTEPDLVLVAITSNIAAATSRYEHVLKDWQSAGLKFPSATKPVLFTLDPTLVRHKVGSVSKGDLRAIDETLRRMLALG